MVNLDEKTEEPPCNPEIDRKFDKTFEIYFCGCENVDCRYRIELPMFGDRRFACEYHPKGVLEKD
jgi:hypothetical protein